MKRYFVGLVGDYPTTAEGLTALGACNWWTCDGALTPGEAMFVVMHDELGTPHPNWAELPHPLDTTPVHGHLRTRGKPEHLVKLQDHMGNGRGLTDRERKPVPGLDPLRITQTDTTLSLALKIHAHYPCFRP